MTSETRSTVDGAPDEYGTAASDRGLREAHVAIGSSDFDAIGIDGLVSLWSEAGLRGFEAISCHGDGAVVQVAVERPLDADRLDALECVDRWEHVPGAEAAELYVVEFTAPEFPPSLADRTDGLLGTCDPELDEHGVTMSFVGPQRAIAQAIEAYETAGVSPDLRRLGSYRGHERPLDVLTERQREVLTTAYEMGYYDVPRTASSMEVATELGLEPSTVVEHLQRAERNFLKRQLPTIR
ncbi:MAG: helix-turn-helix domain-containing protein [Halolamina sp.]